MDRGELLKICARVLDRARCNPKGMVDIEVVALALQRYLVGEARKSIGDRRAYQREYMRNYREGKRRRGKKRRK